MGREGAGRAAWGNSEELPTAAFAWRPACCLAGCLYTVNYPKRPSDDGRNAEKGPNTGSVGPSHWTSCEDHRQEQGPRRWQAGIRCFLGWLERTVAGADACTSRRCLTASVSSRGARRTVSYLTRGANETGLLTQVALSRRESESFSPRVCPLRIPGTSDTAADISSRLWRRASLCPRSPQIPLRHRDIRRPARAGSGGSSCSLQWASSSDVHQSAPRA